MFYKLDSVFHYSSTKGHQKVVSHVTNLKWQNEHLRSSFLTHVLYTLILQCDGTNFLDIGQQFQTYFKQGHCKDKFIPFWGKYFE